MTNSPKMVRVWDIGVRLFHWSLVVLVTSAWLFEDERTLHRWLGYGVIGLISFRLIWGFVGTRFARFVNFVPGPVKLLSYLRDMAKGRERRYLGHNPAGGAMIVALLLTLAAITGTGVMMGMDAYFGEEWVEDVHEVLANFLILLVLLHIGGVVLASRRHKENLVKSMVTGLKPEHE